MVTVQNKVRVANAVKLHWRQPHALGRSPHAGPARLIGIMQWQKAAREICIAAHAANNRIQRHFLQAARRGMRQP